MLEIIINWPYKLKVAGEPVEFYPNILISLPTSLESKDTWNKVNNFFKHKKGVVEKKSPHNPTQPNNDSVTLFKYK